MDWSPEELQRMHDERLSHRASLGDLPLVVISQAPDTSADSLAAERAAQQRDLVVLSRRGTRIVASHAGHNVHVEEPSLVVQAIDAMVDGLRSSSGRRTR